LGVKTDGFGTSMFSMSAESLKPCQVTSKNKKTYGVFESDLPPGDTDGSLGSGSGSTNG
jgi:hypothetical protein